MIFATDASYDAWKTTPPEYDDRPAVCEQCGETYDAREQMQDGDECRLCGAHDVQAIDNRFGW